MKKVGFLCLFLSLGFAGCFKSLPPTSSKPSSRYGGILILSANTDPKSFNPIMAKETSTTTITGYIFEGLTRTDGLTLEVKPDLAERWEVSKDGKEWIFHLRSDVTWQDGKPFTADDVIFTFENLIFNPDIPTSSRDIFLVDGQPIRLEKLGTYTVKFILPEKFAPFLRLLNQEILPRHILKEKVDKGIFTSAWGVNEQCRNIVGTGPFKLVGFRPGEWVLLDRNPLYWKKDVEGNHLPYLDRIVYLTLADPNMAILKFRAGEIDACSLRGPDYAILKPLEIKGDFNIFTVGPGLGEEFLTFNQSNTGRLPSEKIAWFRNLNFRKAVAHSLDKKNIIKNVLAGFGIPQSGPLNASAGYFYNPKVPAYDYDLDKARVLLTEGQFQWKDGILYDRAGQPVEFTILTNSNNGERIQTASLIQDDLKKLGMKVNILPLEFNTLVTKLSVTKDWEAVLIGLTGGIEPHSGKNVWHSSGQLHLWNLGPDNQPADWEQEVNWIFEQGSRELDPYIRKKLYDRWQEIIVEELPVIHTVNSLVMYAVRNKFGNLKPSVYGGPFHNIEEIYVVKNSD